MRSTKFILAFALSVTGLALLSWLFTAKAVAVSPTITSTSPDGVWQVLEQSRARSAIAASTNNQRTIRLNLDALRQQLAAAPMEGSGALRHSPVILSLPMPDGSFQRFHIEESPVMEPDLAARLPEVKTYRGQGIDDASATTRFDWTLQGFHALVLQSNRSVYIDPATKSDTLNYLSRFSDDIPHGTFTCGVTEADVAEATARGVYAASGVTPKVSNGTTLRTYRLAIAATGEWTSQYGGGTVSGAQTSITTMVNLIDAIYEKEVAIHFILVNNTNIIFTNASTDPYASPNAADSAALSANETTLDNNALLGSANYDVGHLFGSGSSFFSGLAAVGVTCSAGNKAMGVSTMTGGSVTNSQFIGGIAHEIGHEFSATHTYNATAGSCGPQRTASSAYEVGSGSTIMAYSICASEDTQPQTDNHFHVRSLEQIVNYATTSGTCASTAATGNAVPIVSGPGNYTIPANTPFQLSATASDSNGPLTYSWEQYDLGAAGPPDTDDGTRPIFRCYPAQKLGTRYFPSLQYILNNANVPPTTYSGGCFDTSGNPIQCLTGESLPTTNRTLHFQAVVRDNQANGGAINTVSSALTVVNTAGPFAVTSPNGGESWSGARAITWNVASTNVAPVSTTSVKITLSTDGGQTFPITLLSAAPNNGSASVTIPNGIISSTARVKIEGVNNVFFDISNANFSISPADSCPAISSVSPQVGVAGNTVTITGVNFTGVNAVTFSNNVPAASFMVVDANHITATIPAGATGGPITLSKPGCTANQSTNFSFCSGSATSIAVDDGSVESPSTIGVAGAYYVNRLTPSSYPATLNQVSIYWNSFQNFPPGTPINVVAGANTGGTTTIDGTSLQSVPVTAGAQLGFTTYTLNTPITISSGDFVVGFQATNPPSNSFPVAVDTTSSNNRSYYSSDGASFSLASGGNFMIRAAQVFSNCNTGAPSTLSIVSRKLHGGIPFDIPLPLSGNVGIESRSGGATNDYQVVFTFNNPVTFSGASVSPGTGSVANSSGSGTSTVTVNLTGITDQQQINVRLTNANDGSTTGTIVVPMIILVGDVNGDKIVNSADATITRNNSGNPAGATNFRADFNTDGTINSGDATIVRARSGDFVP